MAYQGLSFLQRFELRAKTNFSERDEPLTTAAEHWMALEIHLCSSLDVC